MRAYLNSHRAGQAADGFWVDVGVFRLPFNGSHWTARASVETPDATTAVIELRGSSGTTKLWSGAIDRVPELVVLPVTMPGDTLALRAQIPKPVRAHFEIAWIQRGELPEDDLCDR